MYKRQPVPCARSLTPEEVNAGYEHNTGVVIVETFQTRNINPVHVPGVICRNHGPFAWGKDAAQAVYHAVVLELSLIHIWFCATAPRWASSAAT